MRIGVLTGGGDCPGLNAVIRAATWSAVMDYGDEVVGIMHGWQGLLEDDTLNLDVQAISGILPRGGTILRTTSSVDPFALPDGPQQVMENAAKHRLDVVLAIGGDGTLDIAYKLQQHGLKVIGIPKTIDNDLSATDTSFGFDTAVQTATEAIDRLHSTAESHDRVIVVEVMGRYTGWIAVMAGLAGGADAVVIPEFPLTVEEICEVIDKRSARGKRFSLVVVAEGARVSKQSGTGALVTQGSDRAGHERLGGVGALLGEEIAQLTGFDTRITVLGHVQRGGTPTAHDRILATRYGLKGIELVHAGAFGQMAALRGADMVGVPLQEAIAQRKRVPKALYEQAKTFFR